MPTRLLNQLAPFLIATGIPLALMSCSSGDDDSGAAGAGGTGTSATGGTGTSGGAGGTTGGTGTGGSATGGTGTGGSATGGTGTGGSATGGTGTGGSATGGTGTGGSATGGTGTGGSATGGTGTGGAALGGMGGKAMAGSGGTAGKGTAGGANGGAPSGGMGGKSSGGASSGGANGAGNGGGAGTGGGGTFTLASTDQMDGAKFDGKFTCNGGGLGSGINPELHWSGSPAGAMSFAITFIDTTIGADSSMGQHWAMYNVPASVMEIAQGALTKTLMGDISTAKQATPLNNGFLAPCAQSLKNGMDDNYEFTIYALSTTSLSGAGTSVASVLQALGVLNSSGKLVSPPMLNTAVLGTAVLHGHAGLKGQ